MEKKGLQVLMLLLLITSVTSWSLVGLKLWQHGRQAVTIVSESEQNEEVEKNNPPRVPLDESKQEDPGVETPSTEEPSEEMALEKVRGTWQLLFQRTYYGREEGTWIPLGTESVEATLEIFEGKDFEYELLTTSFFMDQEDFGEMLDGEPLLYRGSFRDNILALYLDLDDFYLPLGVAVYDTIDPMEIPIVLREELSGAFHHQWETIEEDVEMKSEVVMTISKIFMEGEG